MKASAIANANMALVKYWGKRDSELILPQAGSVSMTMSGMTAHTTVEFNDSYKEDIFILDEKEYKAGSEAYDDYIEKFLGIVRKISGTDTKVKIQSQNNFPTGAGLASSAAGFAALAKAVDSALNLSLSDKELSILARQGSGSATRSIFGGFAEWKRGKLADGSDSFAEQIVKEAYWPEFRLVACVTSKKEKKVKSRAGMDQTVNTSPLYPNWIESTKEDVEQMKNLILKKDFTKVGELAEHNALKMHAVMMTTKPSLIYFNPLSLELMHYVQDSRDNGLELYFTIDAGPQIKILCLEKDVERLQDDLSRFENLEEVIVTKPGPGARLSDEHLF